MYAAYVAANVVQRTWLRALVAAGTLLLGVTPQVSLWDLALQSDSLALSLTVAAIACWILLATRVDAFRSLRSGRSPFSGRHTIG